MKVRIRIKSATSSTLLLILLNLWVLVSIGKCNAPKYFDSDTYSDCFQNASGWYHVSATCIFPLTQFERKYSTAVQMCGSINHSIGYRETNWLIAAQLFDLFTSQSDPELLKMYWTGLQVKSNVSLGVESEDATDDFSTISPFTSIYNPLWADGEPSETLSDASLTSSCVALDVRNSSSFGWRVLPCSTQLPILCQNYACLQGTFRCLDNSKCIPPDFLNDGFNDCLDGSDEQTTTTSSFDASSMFLHDAVQKTYEWPMRVSSGGVLTPSTVRYGRGECTHRWTVLSPDDRQFVIFIKWLTYSTATTILIEGKDESGRIFVSSRNATSSIAMSSSSFVLTASNTDTRKMDFQVYYQDIDPSICSLSHENRLLFSSTITPTPCSYQFTTATPTSYVALLIHKCEGTTSTVAHIVYGNTTVTLAPRSVKKLLVLPTNHLEIQVTRSTWPGSETQLEIQVLEVAMGGESVNVFMVDDEFEVEWREASEDVRMDGEFRSLMVNMISTADVMGEATWQIRGFRKTCSEDNVQIIFTNSSQHLPTGSSASSGVGPSTVLIQQSAEPFEFRATFRAIGSSTLSPIASTIASTTASTTALTTALTTTPPTIDSFCPLPSVRNGYIRSVSNPLYTYSTVVTVQCLEGFYDLAPIECMQNGDWRFNGGVSRANSPLECRPIFCPNFTSVEETLNLIPDGYPFAYGAMRRYRNWDGASFGPFCVCSDIVNGEWSCYNDQEPGYQRGACIRPQMDDALVLSEDLLVYPPGHWLHIQCLMCPTMQESYICSNGLWYLSGTRLQPYASFRCDCASDPDFIDPCKPHGHYQQESGEFICICDTGYKFFNGTCQDRDECEEGSSYCDHFATCRNTDGGFTCECPQGFHIYNSTWDLPQWSPIAENLIEGYSCIEDTCYAKISFDSALNVIEPPALGTTSWYRSGDFTDNYYATNICSAEYRCVMRFRYHCLGETLFPNGNPLAACPALDGSVFSYGTVEPPQFHLFQYIEVKCSDTTATMIGRPLVFCNSSYQWEVLPECVQESCADISYMIKPPLQFTSSNSDGVYLWNTVLTFSCSEGELVGASSTTCSKDGIDKTMYWNNNIPTCITPTQTSTAPTISSSFSMTPFSNPPSSAPGTTGAASTAPIISTFFPSPYYPSTTDQFSNPPSSAPGTTGVASTFDPVSFPSTRGSTTASQTTTSAFPDDFIVQDSAVFVARNALDEPSNWMMTGDWSWTPSKCALHQLIPASFMVTTIPIQLTSEDIELSVDVSMCQANFNVAVFTSDDTFIPSLSEFRTVLNATTAGTFVVKLGSMRRHLAMAIRANGVVEICGVAVRERMCKAVDVEGVHLMESGAFSMRRYIAATCNRVPTTVSGYCDSRRGWVIQKTACTCNPSPMCVTPAPPPAQRDQAKFCGINSCSNGQCVQYENDYTCICNRLFIQAFQEDGTPYCKPDHCARTSADRNSGYNCETGENDPQVTCPMLGQYGSFCQYQGQLSNASYIYILSQDYPLAIATNVCNNVETVYAIPDVTCAQKPTPSSPTPSTACDICKDALITCEKSSPPFVNGAFCRCQEGGALKEYGRSCAVKKFCFDEDGSYRCENGGVCNLTEQICECREEFGGDRCEIYNGTDRCEPSRDCGNGRCVTENGVVYCNCDDGYIKDSDGRCTVKWDMCALNNPCQQNGTCNFNEDTGDQICSFCRGWEGDFCERQPQTISCSFCQHAQHCFDAFTNSSRCQCATGYGGISCSDPVSECDFSPCLNGGTCNVFNFDEAGVYESYNCTCPTGKSGANCELNSDPPVRNCSDFIICENGGTCSFDSSGNPICHCVEPYFGAQCERLNVCDIIECLNGATCNNITQLCECSQLFYGTYCENDGNLCVKNRIDCENGGTCMAPRINSTYCECAPNYTGELCENQIHSCTGITCNNGGTCIPSNGTCACPLGTTGDRCQNLGQRCADAQYCLNGGVCTDLPNGVACDCSRTEYTGRRCEIQTSFNFNLVFNGLPYEPPIVSPSFSNQAFLEFTLCSFVQYNNPSNGSQDVTLPPYLSLRGYGNGAQQLVFDNKGFYMCTGRQCSRATSGFLKEDETWITANTWHHFCVVSNKYQETAPKYSVYLDGLNVKERVHAEAFAPGDSAYVQLAPANNNTIDRFVGMISMTQLFITRLNATQIGQLAYDCFNTATGNTFERANETLIHWNNFTRVSSYNPGVFVDPAGICKSVKCMFGRQVNTNNFNSTGTCDKDRISPTVLRCPSNIRQHTELDFVKVEWKDEDVSFFDNIGVVRIDVNYHNGQQFGVGITAVRYLAFDAAGNSAECTFDVIVDQNRCPNPSNLDVENGNVISMTESNQFVDLISFVKCNDQRFPRDNQPRFYTCDIMGESKYGSWFGNKYFLPSCGKTTPAVQSVNGTVVDNGTCQEIHSKLRDTIWRTANCDQILSCNLTISPPCYPTIQTSQQALQYIFRTRNSTSNIPTTLLSSLKVQFDAVRQDGEVDCDDQHPLKDTSGNTTICVSCPSGTFADISLSKCTDCPLNTYREPGSSNQLECTPCPEGTTTGDVTGAMDESACYKSCPIGEFEQRGNCVDCPIGTYGDRVALRKCTCCSFDTSTFANRSTNVAQCTKTCQPGFEMVRSPDFPAPECVECAKGYYKDQNLGPCLQCPRGLTTSNTGSNSIDNCNQLYCIDLNTRRNSNITVGPSTPYSEMCIACEQGQYQNTPNSDTCLPCSSLPASEEDVPVTCQSTCSTEIKTDGCNCQVNAKYANCLPEVEPVHHLNPLKIVLPVVFGVLLLIIVVTAFCFRKQIIAWFKKSATSDNQHVAPSHWTRQSANETPIMRRSSDGTRTIPPPTSIIPRPNLRIMTDRHQLENLPPMPSSSTPSFHVDSYPSNGFNSGITQRSSAGRRVSFEANGSPKIGRTPHPDSDESSVDSFF